VEADTSIKSQRINGYKSIESFKTVNSAATVALKKVHKCPQWHVGGVCWGRSSSQSCNPRQLSFAAFGGPAISPGQVLAGDFSPQTSPYPRLSSAVVTTGFCLSCCKNYNCYCTEIMSVSPRRFWCVYIARWTTQHKRGVVHFCSSQRFSELIHALENSCVYYVSSLLVQSLAREYITVCYESTGWPKKVSHCQVIKKSC